MSVMYPCMQRERETKREKEKDKNKKEQPPSCGTGQRSPGICLQLIMLELLAGVWTYPLVSLWDSGRSDAD